MIRLLMNDSPPNESSDVCARSGSGCRCGYSHARPVQQHTYSGFTPLPNPSSFVSPSGRDQPYDALTHEMIDELRIRISCIKGLESKHIPIPSSRPLPIPSQPPIESSLI